MKSISYVLAIAVSIMQPVWADTVSLTATPRASQTPIIMGVQKYFPEIAKKHGIIDGKIHIEYHRSSADALNLLIKGDKHITVASLPAVINLHVKNPGTLQFLSMTNTADAYLMCRQDVQSIQDIKQRSLVIAISSKHTSPHLIVKNIAMQHFGDPDALESNIIVMSGQQSQQLLMSGNRGIACALTGVPVQNQLEEAGFKKMFVQGQASWPGWQNAYVVNAQWARQNPKVVAALVETFRVVTAAFNQDPEPFVRLFITQEKLNIDSVTLTRQYQSSRNHAVTKFSDQVLDMLKFSEQVGFSTAGGLRNFEQQLIVRPDLL